jgi:hypothetical protein
VITDTLPRLLGLIPNHVELPRFESTAGYAGWQLALAAAAFLWLGGRTLTRAMAAFQRRALHWPSLRFLVYLLLVGLGAMAAPVFFVGMDKEINLTRYCLLSLLSVVALFALFLRLETWAPSRRAGAGFMVALGAFNVGVVALWMVRYCTPPVPVDPHRVLADALVQRGVVTGVADYWDAYATDFYSGGRVHLTPRQTVRVPAYERELDQAPIVTVIADGPCVGGERVAAWFICRARRSAVP